MYIGTKEDIIQTVWTHREWFLPDFPQWLNENYHVFEVFVNHADELWNRGRRFYSSRTICEKMRFDHDVRENNSKFKISNTRTPDLGRLYVVLHPLRVDMFAYQNTNKRGDFSNWVKKELLGDNGED
jgi:hypothetical protein